MKQDELNLKLKKYEERNPGCFEFCDGLDENTYREEEEKCKLFSNWFRDKKNLIISPKIIYHLWCWHSSDWDAQYLFMYTTDDKFEEQSKHILELIEWESK